MNQSGIMRWQGPFRPVAREHRHVPLTMEGRLPPSLCGTLYRIGPNPYHPTDTYPHWIDGDGMVHAIRIEQGRATTYTNRWVLTKALERERKLGRKLRRGLWTPAKQRELDNTANTNLLFFSGRLWALWEQGLPFELDMISLESLGELSLAKDQASAFLAHSKVCPWTGHLVTLDHHLAMKQGTFKEFGLDFVVIRQQPLPLSRPSVIHDFALSPNFYVAHDAPLCFDERRLRAGEFPYHFDTRSNAYLHILPRYPGREPLKIPLTASFVFHFVRAIERDSELLVEAVKLDEVTYAEPLTGKSRGQLVRWTIELSTGNLREQQLLAPQLEFPICSPRTLLGEEHRLYACLFRADDRPLFGGLISLNSETGECSQTFMPDGYHCSEPIYLSAGPEDSRGLIFTLANTDDRDETLGFFYHSENLHQGPVACVRIPYHIPQGFHGIWVAEPNTGVEG
jgi:carotenoid cleavage dioxygenase-like enzyme